MPALYPFRVRSNALLDGIALATTVTNIKSVPDFPRAPSEQPSRREEQDSQHKC
jgi:hypothetical protein